MKVRVPYTFSPNKVRVPASKSYAQRYILAAALGNSPVTLKNCGSSADVLAMIDVAKKLGTEVQGDGNVLTITPKKNKCENSFFLGESGLATRLIVPILSALGGRYTISGTGSLTKRDMSDMVDFLKQNGITFDLENSTLPISFQGNLTPKNLRLNGQTGSQVVSGLLMALPLLKERTTLQVHNLASKPYVDLTLEVLSDFGIQINHNTYTSFDINGNQHYEAIQSEFEIEGDFSAASNWIVTGAIAEYPIHIAGLNKASKQADSAILNVVERSGAILDWRRGELCVTKNENKPFEFDATHCPDLFPALVVLAAAANGRSVLHGAERLGNKESNRSFSLQTEFKKLNLQIDLHGDEMIVHGNGKLTAGTFFSHNDHRIAMAGAIAATLTKGINTIEGAEAVAKSYPEFWDHCGIA